MEISGVPAYNPKKVKLVKTKDILAGIFLKLR